MRRMLLSIHSLRNFCTWYIGSLSYEQWEGWRTSSKSSKAILVSNQCSDSSSQSSSYWSKVDLGTCNTNFNYIFTQLQLISMILNIITKLKGMNHFFSVWSASMRMSSVRLSLATVLLSSVWLRSDRCILHIYIVDLTSVGSNWLPNWMIYQPLRCTAHFSKAKEAVSNSLIEPNSQASFTSHVFNFMGSAHPAGAAQDACREPCISLAGIPPNAFIAGKSLSHNSN